jgi:predicted neuraminidase
MAISDDHGNTWTSSLPVVGRGNVQPSIIQKKDGSLVAFMRDNGDEPGRIMVSTSNDEGYTWTIAQKTDIPNPGASVEAIALKNGEWVLIYNNQEDGRNRLVISLSEDEGKSWKWTRVMEEREPGKGSFSYPSIIQSEDGLIHATFSYHLNKERSIKHVTFPINWIKE